MFERSANIFKLLCVVVGAVVIYQLATAISQRDPLAKVSFPQVPSVTSSNTATSGKGTNASATKAATSSTTNSATTAGTNSVTPSTNPSKAKSSITASSTNAEAEVSSTNVTTFSTNQVPAAPVETNITTTTTNQVLANQVSGLATNSTNGTAAVKSTNGLANGTNLAPVNRGTNGGTGSVQVASATSTNNAPASGTNPPPPGKGGPGPRPRPEMAGGPAFPGMPGMGGPPGRSVPVPPEIQARVDRITESELLAPVQRPLPMALLGIVGKDVFLRAPSGQTGLVKEGDELGGVKILRVGINRVLIQLEGEKKELTLFDGLGSESLLPKEKDKPK